MRSEILLSGVAFLLVAGGLFVGLLNMMSVLFVIGAVVYLFAHGYLLRRYPQRALFLVRISVLLVIVVFFWTLYGMAKILGL